MFILCTPCLLLYRDLLSFSRLDVNRDLHLSLLLPATWCLLRLLPTAYSVQHILNPIILQLDTHTSYKSKTALWL